MSVPLFPITINEFIERLDSKIEQHEGGNAVESFQLVFIDDIIILNPFLPNAMIDKFGDKICQNKGPVTDYLKTIEEFSKWSGLKLNCAKTFATTFEWGL